jgi:hypothetical protein
MEAMNQPISGRVGKHLAQHDAMHQKRRRGAEGNQIGQGIEFPAKGAFDAAHAGQAAIEQIENAGQQDESSASLISPFPAGPGGASTILVRPQNQRTNCPPSSDWAENKSSIPGGPGLFRFACDGGFP